MASRGKQWFRYGFVAVVLAVSLAALVKLRHSDTGKRIAALMKSSPEARRAWITDMNPELANIADVRILQTFMRDPGRTAEYATADAALPPDPERIIFLGDSITLNWQTRSEYFRRHPHYVNRGIGGNSSAQMLLRFQQDVANLHPQVVVLLAGTNDAINILGDHPVSWMQNNILAMLAIAKANGITPIVCSLPPILRYPRIATPVAPEVYQKTADLNAWLAKYTAENGILFADLHPLFLDGQGRPQEGFLSDGIHPNTAGYQQMELAVQARIDEALARRASRPSAP